MIVGDESMMQVEKSPSKKVKSMVGVEEEVGDLKSLENFMRESPKNVEGFFRGELMSGMRQLISLRH